MLQCFWSVICCHDSTERLIFALTHAAISKLGCALILRDETTLSGSSRRMPCLDLSVFPVHQLMSACGGIEPRKQSAIVQLIRQHGQKRILRRVCNGDSMRGVSCISRPHRLIGAASDTSRHENNVGKGV